MTQRVSRAERLRRQRTGDRGFVYRGAHVYAWVDEVRRELPKRRPIDTSAPGGFARALAHEMYGLTESAVRSTAFHLGCADLLADVLSGFGPAPPPMAGVRAWIGQEAKHG